MFESAGLGFAVIPATCQYELALVPTEGSAWLVLSERALAPLAQVRACCARLFHYKDPCVLCMVPR